MSLEPALAAIASLLVVVALLAVCTGAGLAVLRTLDALPSGPLERLVFAAALGTGLAAWSIALLSLAIGPRGGLLWAIATLTGVLLRKAVVESGALVRASIASLWAPGACRVPGPVAVGFLAVVAGFTLLFALAPPSDWDSLMYHIRVPVQWLERGRVFLPADNLHAAYVGLPHALYLMLLPLGLPAAPAVLSTAYGLLLGLSCAAAGERLFGTCCSRLGLILLWGTPSIILVMMTPRVDVTLALYLFLAHYCLLSPSTAAAPRRRGLLAAVFLGLALAVKYHGVIYLAALSPLLLMMARRDSGRLASIPAVLGQYALIAAVAMFPWLLKNGILLGAPTFPFLAKPRLEPWLTPIFGQMHVPPSVDPEIFTFLAAVRQPFNVWDAFFAPHRLTVELEGAYYFTNPILLLAPLVLLFFRTSIILWLAAPPLIYLAVLIGAYPANNLRYLIPAVPALTLASCVALDQLQSRLGSLAGRWALGVGLAIGLAPMVLTIGVWLRAGGALGYLAGRESAAEYLEHHMDPGVAAYARMAKVLEHEVPVGARVLLLFEGRGYYLPREVLADPRVTNWPLLATSGKWRGCLADAGVTHVVVATRAMDYYVARGLAAQRLEGSMLQSFVAECLAPIARESGYDVYAVRAGTDAFGPPH